ncbi:hypothetical protein V5O48_018057 [Marasmius crinis-equi]|uniref:F-box domain-containing protein n=1 Tax=Marasmius crinis-equi TaxID=585013 RepID=A0ABR3EMA9_9AGAR
MESVTRRTVTPANRAMINQYLEDGERELRRYDTQIKRSEAEINRHRASILAAEGKRERLKRSMATYRSHLAPVHRLPTEILEEIFALLCCTKKGISLDPGQRPLPAPVLLSTVCGRWREDCVSSPRLWSYVSLDTWFESLDVDSVHEGRLQRMMELVMERSQSHPLHIDLNCPFDWEELQRLSLYGVLSVALEYLCKHSNRWAQLAIIAPDTTIIDHPILSRIERSIPRLHTLAIDVPVELPLDLHVFRFSPALHTLYLILYGPFDNLSDIPWSQLRNLTLIMNEAPISIQEILSSCSNLQHLEFKTMFEMAEGDSQWHVASPLKSLTFRPSPSANSLLSHISLPNLSSLELTLSPLSSSRLWAEAALSGMITRSKCSITALSLSSVTISDQQALFILRLIPTLKYFFVQERVIGEPHILTSSFLSRLVIRNEFGTDSQSTCLVPHLTDLRIVASSKHLDAVAFSEAVVSRWIPDATVREQIGVSSLRSVEIEFTNKSDAIPECLGALKCFSDAGLRVSFGWRSEPQPLFDIL